MRVCRPEVFIRYRMVLVRFLLLGWVVCVSGNRLSALSTNGFTYVISGRTVTITSYDCRSSDILIPAQIEGLPVTTIQGYTDSQGFAHGAFENCIKADRVTIPDTVTRLGVNAFFNCGMSNVVVPDSVVQIDGNAFADCYRLTQIKISNNTQTIGLHAFFGCVSV